MLRKNMLFRRSERHVEIETEIEEKRVSEGGREIEVNQESERELEILHPRCIYQLIALKMTNVADFGISFKAYNILIKY